MTWSALIALLMQFFGPLIQKWLDGLFTTPTADSPANYDPPAGMLMLFANARAKTWWWQFTRRAVLNACERVATKRAGEFWATMRTNSTAPKMSDREQADMASVL